MKSVVILGAGGFAREVASFLQSSDCYRITGFTDPNVSLQGTYFINIPVLGNDNVLKDLAKEKVSHAFIAIGNSERREVLFKKISKLGLKLINVIHPSAAISGNVSLGEGVAIYPNVTINTDVTVGKSVLINSNVSIGHDVEIGDFVNIQPGVNIAGRVKIERSALLGIGCSVLEGVFIGEKAVIGGGALVRRDVLPKTTVFGVPARINHQRNN